MMKHQIIYWVFGLCLLISVPFTECIKIHEQLTEDEIFNIFHTTPDAVPEYEIVPIEHSLLKRSTPKDFRLKFEAFDTNVDIYLNPNDGTLVGEDTPVWIAENVLGKLQYRKLKQGIMKQVLGVYQSLPGKAALVVRARENGNLKFDGTVGNMMVAPLPNRVQDEIRAIKKLKRDLSNTTRSIMTTEYHIVYRSMQANNVTNKPQDIIEKNSEQIDVTRSKRFDRDIVFPTILVTTDFDVHLKSKEDIEYYDQIIYQLAFWNGVDLRFRHLNNPKVRLRIAGLIIGSGRNATPYVKDHIVGGDVELIAASSDMWRYWGEMSTTEEFSLEGYNIIVTATNLNLFSEDKPGTKSMLGGYAVVSSFCTHNYGKFYPAFIFKDNLGFGGVNVATHELGHVLGAIHDEGMEAGCTKADGYLMAPALSRTENNLQWSNCSLQRLTRVLSYEHCADQPKVYFPSGKPLGKILPGTVKTIEEQCQARGYHWACHPIPSICKNLRCWNSGFVSFFTTLLSCQTSYSAAEGTECGLGRVCLDGECKSLFKSL